MNRVRTAYHTRQAVTKLGPWAAGIGVFAFILGTPGWDNGPAQASVETAPEIETAALSEAITPAIDLIGASGCQVMVMGAEDIFSVRQNSENVIQFNVAMGSMAGTSIEIDRNENTLLMSTPEGSEKHKIGIGIKNMFQTSLIGDQPMQCQTTMNPETGLYKLTCEAGDGNSTEISLRYNKAALVIPTVTATTDQSITNYRCAMSVEVPAEGTVQKFAYKHS